MADKVFDNKEVLSFSWQMVQKYWKVILKLGIIYIAFQIIIGVIGQNAGTGFVSPKEMSRITKNELEQKRVYALLQEKGYISNNGSITEKLQNTTQPNQLELAPDIESNRVRIYEVLNAARYRLPVPKFIYYIFYVCFFILNFILSLVSINIFLGIAREEECVELSTDCLNWRKIIFFVLGSLCYGLVVFGGTLLLIVPGIIFAIAYQFWQYYCIDKGLGPIASIKESGKITKGYKWHLAIFGLWVLLLNLAGLLCLFIGLAVTIPMTYVAAARVFDILDKNYQVKQVPPTVVST